VGTTVGIAQMSQRSLIKTQKTVIKGGRVGQYSFDLLLIYELHD
jgi:hypothetical protein